VTVQGGVSTASTHRCTQWRINSAWYAMISLRYITACSTLYINKHATVLLQAAAALNELNMRSNCLRDQSGVRHTKRCVPIGTWLVRLWDSY